MKYDITPVQLAADTSLGCRGKIIKAIGIWRAAN